MRVQGSGLRVEGAGFSRGWTELNFCPPPERVGAGLQGGRRVDAGWMDAGENKRARSR